MTLQDTLTQLVSASFDGPLSVREMSQHITVSDIHYQCVRMHVTAQIDQNVMHINGSACATMHEWTRTDASLA